MTQVQTFLVGQGIASRVFYWLIRSLIKVFCRIYFRLGVYGRENIPQSGAFILAPIHRSNVDTPIVSVVTKRRLRFMGKDSLWKVKPVGAVLSALGGFPVTRGTADLEALKRCLAVLSLGEPLVMFPEGTRQSGPKFIHCLTVLPTCQLSLECQLFRLVLVAPRVSCQRVRKILPKKCSVVVGKPIFPPQSDSGRLPRLATTDLTAALSEALQIVFDQAKQKAGQTS